MDTKKFLEQLKNASIAETDCDLRQKMQLMTDYYNGYQITDWQTAYNAYLTGNPSSANNYYNGISKDSPEYYNIYEVHGKIGPLELEDGVMGKKIFYNRWPQGYPLTKKVVDTLANAYEVAPSRSFQFTIDNDLKNRLLEETLDDIDLNNLLLKIDRYSILHGVAGILIEYIQDRDENDENQDDIFESITIAKGKLRLTPVLAHNLAVEKDENNEVVAVIITYETYNNDTHERDVVSRGITATQDILTKKDKNGDPVTVTKDNELGIIPIVWLHYDPYPEDFWTPGIGETLCSENRSINQDLAHLDLLMRYQTQNIRIIKDLDFDENKPLQGHPGAVNHASSRMQDMAGDVITLSPTTSLDQVRTVIENKLKFYIDAYSLPVDTFKASVSNSSVAQLEQREPLRKARLQRLEIIQHFERRFWKLIIKVLGTYQTDKFLNDNPKVSVKFPVWPKGGMQELLNLYRMGLIESTSVNGVAMFSPEKLYRDVAGMSDEDIQAMQKDTEKFNQEVKNARAESGQQGKAGIGEFPANPNAGQQ